LVIFDGLIRSLEGRAAGGEVNVLDHLLNDVQSKLANTGAAELLDDPIAMHGTDSRTVSFEGSHGQKFQGPRTGDE
jgi:hypothetical protein